MMLRIPFFILITKTVLIEKKNIHPITERKPLNTTGWVIFQDLDDIARKPSVVSVKGRNHPIERRR